MYKSLVYYIFIFNTFIQAGLDFKNYKYIKPQLKQVFRKSKTGDYIKSHPSHPKKSIKNSTGFSTNWSGYGALTNLTNPKINSVTYVAGTWIVPKLSPSKDVTYSASWVGIDGFVSPTVEQLGTEQDWYNGAQHNYAWFEMYPAVSMQFANFPISTGDLVTAAVTYLGNNIFLLSILNNTKKIHTYVSKSSRVAQRSSAEWIMEAPCCTNSGDILPLAHFNQINFFNCTCTIKNVTGAINNKTWQNQKIDMVTNNGKFKAITSNLTCGGKNFNVIWKHQ